MPVAVVDHELRVRGLSEDLAEDLRRALTFPNPAANGRGGLGQSRLLRYYTEDGGIFSAPRGAVSVLMEAARRRAVEVEWRPAVTSRGSGRVSPETDMQLRPYQAQALERFLSRRQGWAEIPCGGGKTVLGCAALAACGEPGIVLVHTTDLADQWATTLPRAGVGRVRRVGGGETGSLRPLSLGEVAVCTVQAIDRAGPEADQLLRSAGALILDECHHLSADTFLGPVARCPARYRWGLSATPDRPDGMGFLLDVYLGPRLFRIGVDELVQMGHLLLPSVVAVDTGWEPDDLDRWVEVRCSRCKRIVRTTTRRVRAGEAECKGRTCAEVVKPDHLVGVPLGEWDWSGVQTDQWRSAERLQIVVNLAEAAYAAGRTVLVLVPRVAATDDVVRQLRRRGVPCAAATGASSRLDRASRLRQVRSGALPVLVATQLADEGLDVPNLDCLILASAGRAEGRAVQRVGRTMRPSGAAVPLVFDLVDGNLFRGQWYKRAAAYRRAIGAEPIGPVSVGAAIALLGRSAG